MTVKSSISNRSASSANSHGTPRQNFAFADTDNHLMKSRQQKRRKKIRNASALVLNGIFAALLQELRYDRAPNMRPTDKDEGDDCQDSVRAIFVPME